MNRAYSFRMPKWEDAVMSAKARAVREAFALTDSESSRVVLRDVHLPSDGIVYVTGYSGTGKTTLLRQLREDFPHSAALPEIEDPEARPIDILGGRPEDAVRCLCRAGLSEPRAFLTPYSFLSDGQKVRARLALLLWRRPTRVIIDEFLSALDRLTARVVAYNFQKWCRRLGIAATVATAHRDLLEPLAPDSVVDLDFHGCAENLQSKASDCPVLPELEEVEVGLGQRQDCLSLVDRFHYRRLREHLVDWKSAQIRVARYRGKVIGAAVYNRPFPHSFVRMSFFRELNSHVLNCFRVVIHPIFRGVGLLAKLEPLPDSETTVVTSVSTFEVYFPFHLSVGYLPGNDPLTHKSRAQEELEDFLQEHGGVSFRELRRPETAEAFFASLRYREQREIRRLTARIVTKRHVDYCLYLCKLIDVSVEALGGDMQELEDFFGHHARVGAENAPGQILASSLFFPMSSFYKRVR